MVLCWWHTAALHMAREQLALLLGGDRGLLVLPGVAAWRCRVAQRRCWPSLQTGTAGAAAVRFSKAQMGSGRSHTQQPPAFEEEGEEPTETSLGARFLGGP